LELNESEHAYLMYIHSFVPYFEMNTNFMNL